MHAFLAQQGHKCYGRIGFKLDSAGTFAHSRLWKFKAAVVPNQPDLLVVFQEASQAAVRPGTAGGVSRYYLDAVASLFGLV